MAILETIERSALQSTFRSILCMLKKLETFPSRSWSSCTLLLSAGLAEFQGIWKVVYVPRVHVAVKLNYKGCKTFRKLMSKVKNILT